MDFIFYDGDNKGENKLNVNRYKFYLDSPDTSNQKPEKVNLILEVAGELNGDDFGILERLTNWALTSSRSSEAYRHCEFSVVEDDVIKRKYTFSSAFVLDFDEEFDSSAENNAIKKFTVKIKQKYDKMDGFKVESDLSANEEDGE